MTDLISILITTPDEQSATKIAETLVADKLVACAQVEGPLTSTYRWREKIERDQEWRLVLKTVANHFEEVKEKVTSLHPYDLPQFIATPIVQSSEEYRDWVLEQVR